MKHDPTLRNSQAHQLEREQDSFQPASPNRFELLVVESIIQCIYAYRPKSILHSYYPFFSLNIFRLSSLFNLRPDLLPFYGGTEHKGLPAPDVKSVLGRPSTSSRGRKSVGSHQLSKWFISPSKSLSRRYLILPGDFHTEASHRSH